MREEGQEDQPQVERPETDPIGTDQGDEDPEKQVVEDQMMIVSVDIEANEKGKAVQVRGETRGQAPQTSPPVGPPETGDNPSD